jgi:signal transduction histidine kinase
MAVQTMILIPIKQVNKLIGFIGLCESRTERYFTRDEMVLILNIAGQITVALQRAQVITSLQEAEQIKSEMIRLASHDLRNPLAQINGYLELLEENARNDGSKPDQLEYIEGMQRGITKMERLLLGILNIERVESQQPETWQKLSIAPLLGELTNGSVSQMRLKEQLLTVDLPDHIPPIVGSDIQLQQVFTNLIDNAIKYTPEGGKIAVRGRLEADRFIFEVEDNGYGIPADRQEKLFQRFYRAQTPGTEAISGTGLGLSLVKTIVQRHGGEVFFSSEEGVGSTFGCWLPLAT